jgi:hypothetical protein
MRLDEVAAVIRPRAPWEGLDLGFALARHWFAPLWGLWWLTALPVGALGALGLGDSPDLWLLLTWWLKPLYEAPLLYWLSRRLFGERLGVRDLWRARRQVLPLRLLPNLLWRRLSPSRSLQLPLLLLEGLGGRERRRRRQVLQGNGATAAWLTIICVHFEYVLWGSALLLLVLLVPERLPSFDLEAAFLQDDSVPYWVSTLLYWLVMSLVAPFYVAAGFAYYLTRRTELEAWDLELVFRRATGRSRRPRPAVAAAALLLLLPVLGLVQPKTANADPVSREEARALIGEVLAGDDFGRTREDTRWVYAGADEPNAGGRPPDWLAGLLERIGRGADLAAAPLKWGLILVAAVLAALVLRRILRDLPRRAQRHGRPAGSAAPPESLGVAVSAELPADVPAAVRDLIARGEPRGALALLYGASLALLQERHGLEIPQSATELECLTLVRRSRPSADVTRVERLVRAWRRLAYAHRVPEPAELDGLLRDWQAWTAGDGR